MTSSSAAVCYALVYVIFFNDTATTEIYTLSLHDALPIFANVKADDIDYPYFVTAHEVAHQWFGHQLVPADVQDRKSTRLNSSHANISYAVFCLKKKKRSFQYEVVVCVDVVLNLDLVVPIC